MKLMPNEQIMKVYHHDFFAFFIRGFKIWGASLPFFFLASIFSPLASNLTAFYIYSSIIVLFVISHLYDGILFYLDTLIITNQRIVHLDWISPFKYMETQAQLNDIQNIESEEKGFLSRFRLFDYGLFLVETASTKTVIKFEDAPDPEGIKFYVVNLARKSSSIHKPGHNVGKFEELINNKKVESQINKVANN